MEKVLKITSKHVEDITINGRDTQKASYLDVEGQRYECWRSQSGYGMDWEVGQEITVDVEQKSYKGDSYFKINNPNRKPDKSDLILEKLDAILGLLQSGGGASPF